MCDTPCPGFLASGRDCSGHGTCTASAVCVCDAQWAGYDPGTTAVACHTQCPALVAGLSGVSACAGHGTCAPSAACDCYRDPVVGYWAGAGCTECLVEWLGPFCTLQCPKNASGFNCSGHGLCVGKVCAGCALGPPVLSNPRGPGAL